MKRKVYASDHDRIDGILNDLPQYTICTLSLADISSLKDLKCACKQRGINTVGFLERCDYVSAIHLFDKEKCMECPICLSSFRKNDKKIVLTCTHEFHIECFRLASHVEFDRTGEMPRCALCRESIRKY